MTDMKSEAGQALVEFSLAVTIFLVLLMSVVDLGRGIYLYNGVSEAAREIARVTSVHPGAAIGDSSQTASVVATQQSLVPGLTSPTIQCVDITGTPVSSNCIPGDWVEVTVSAPYAPVTPLLSIGGFGHFTMQSTSTVQIQ
jgi:Flp pilus assembly protein TadG